MYIKSISIRNFRLLNETTLALDATKKQDLALLIGKNNSGKTSFIVLFDKFFEISKFNFNDFSICLRKKIREIKLGSDINSCSIQMKIDISYSKEDNLAILSDFILDLNPTENTVKILFECSINSENLLRDLTDIKEEHTVKYIEKNLGGYLNYKYFVYAEEDDLKIENRTKLVEKSLSDIKKLINYQVIHAKRNVSSSEIDGNKKAVLSDLASSYFNKENLFSKGSFGDINDKILEMDDALNVSYAEHFKEYFETAKQFVSGGTLNVISNLESKQILENYSRVVYGDDAESYLPETLNGLGHLNILFLLLKIEVKRKFFEQEKRDINLLFIEEPEAHTHPQMQYIFAQRIKILLKSIDNLQTFITSHSSHIVSQCEFEDLRYFKIDKDNVAIKNFHQDLFVKYSSEPEHFKFIKQFLTLYASELFFAEKVVFIEGTSEKLLLPYFIKQYDDSKKNDKNYVPLTSQNISFIEAGANAKVFRHFIDFLDIKTLIFTDLDGCKIKQNDKGKNYWGACKTIDSINTTNVTIKYYYDAPQLPEIKEQEGGDLETNPFNDWYSNLRKKTLNSISPNVLVTYQTEQGSYHARSFEDAFISVNLTTINAYKQDISGLKNKSEIKTDREDFYELTDAILKPDGKSDFASSILYLALTKDIKWNTPSYIIEGLNWISK